MPYLLEKIYDQLLADFGINPDKETIMREAENVYNQIKKRRIVK